MKKTVIVLMFVLWRVALWGASLNNSSNGGFLAANFNNTSGNVNGNIRGHLSLRLKNISPNYTITLALAKKNKITNGISSEKRKFCFIQANNNMKRFGNLYEQIISKENILLAFKNARKGKKHYKEVMKIDTDPEYYLSALHETLKNGQFVNSKYFIFKRNSGHKIREIYKLPFYPDRLVHHCIVQIMQPIWINSFI
ncbi:MAG: hypothetical protein GXO88_07745, partial [Chlorobi bacterium]|nr:hypothetical protein [Chlorobiota bacterium]